MTTTIIIIIVVVTVIVSHERRTLGVMIDAAGDYYSQACIAPLSAVSHLLVFSSNTLPFVTIISLSQLSGPPLLQR